MSVLTSRPQSTAADPAEPSVMVPTLENGDRLTRAEFERRYEAMPNLKKAELIEGEVYVGSPVRHRQHSKPHGQLMTWLGTYTASTPGTDLGDNGSIRLDLDNEPQPDVFLMIEHERGGRRGSMRTTTSRARPSWSRRSLPAASAMTWVRNCTSTGATASANTSSGACRTARSTGSCSVRAGSTHWLRLRMASSAARSFPGCGSTRPHSCAAIWPPCWRWFSRV